MAILTLKGMITDDGKLEVELPPDAPRGVVEVTLQFEEIMGIPAADLLASDLVGMWADRTDIVDSVEFARQLRRRMSKRNNQFKE